MNRPPRSSAESAGIAAIQIIAGGMLYVGCIVAIVVLLVGVFL